MSRRRQSAPKRRRGRQRGRGRIRRGLERLTPSRRRRQRFLRALRRAPRPAQIALGLVSFLIAWLLVNGIYQVARKPTELFFPVAGTLHKTPTETWRAYGPLFRHHATDTISAELLAALAQIEGSGNPVVRTYWRWAWGSDPFDLYRPASSSVGMYQITDDTFERAKRLCIHDHVVVDDGPWHAWRSCWFNALYFRVVPSHAVELTAAFLDRNVARILDRNRIRSASRAQIEELAAVVHLCGTGAANAYARRGLAFSARARCGNHDPRRYVARVAALRKTFSRLAAKDRG